MRPLGDRKRNRRHWHQRGGLLALDDLNEHVARTRPLIGQPSLGERASAVKERDDVASNKPTRAEGMPRFIAADLDRRADGRDKVAMKPE